MERYSTHCIYILIVTTISKVINAELMSTAIPETGSKVSKTRTASNMSEEFSTGTGNMTKTSFSTNVLDPSTTGDTMLAVIYDFSSVISVKPRKTIYFWDKVNVSPNDFQQSYCLRRCQNGEIVHVHETVNSCPDISCFGCQCTRPQCQIYGICCPDISEKYFPPPEKEFNEKFEKDQTSFPEDHDLQMENAQMSTSKRHPVLGYLTSLMEITTEMSTPLNASQPFYDADNAYFDNFRDKNRIPKLECAESVHVLYIRSCDLELNVSNDVVQRCETGVPEEELTLDTLAFVTDISTKVVYYNQYCAECHGVREYDKWQNGVECTNYIRVYSAMTEDDLVRATLNPDSMCHVQQINPDPFSTVFCAQPWYSSKVTDTCNVTGLWRDYDQDIAEACANISGQIYKVVKSRWLSTGDEETLVYKNIFCAICNMETYPEYNTCESASNGVQKGVWQDSPFSVLFRLKNDKILPILPPTGHCLDTDWTSPNGSCVPVSCSPGKGIFNGSCSTSLIRICGLGYRLGLWFVPQLDNVTSETYKIRVPPSSVILQHFFEKLVAVLDPLFGDLKLTVGAVINDSKMEDFLNAPEATLAIPSLGYLSRTDYTYLATLFPSLTTPTPTDSSHEYILQTPYLYWLSGFVVARSNMSRDEVEESMMEQILNRDVIVDFADNVSVSFKPMVMWYDTDTESYCSKIEQINPDIKCSNASVDTMNDYEYSDTLHLFLNFTKVLTCTYVSFQETQYVIETHLKDFRPVIVVKLDISTTKLTFSDDFQLSKLALGKNRELNICRELLDEKMESLNQFSKADPPKRVQYVLSLACMGVSMLCLLLTVAAYAMFPILRSVAGWNNMCLSASLLTAQACLLASFHTDVNSTLCAPLGMATHFLWLCMFSWSFICCFYMYKVFGAKTRSIIGASRSQTVLLIKNITFSLMAPTVVVAGVIVVVYFTSGGNDIGYGDSVCYLNSHLLVGTVMIGPLVVIIVLNTTFFLVTVFNIHRIRKLQKYATPKKDDQQNIYVYIKLSTMTGAFWVTFVVAEVTDVDGLRIIAIILNGLQGVFIFVSYVCNKRVLVLCLRKLGIERAPTSTSGSVTERSSLGRSTPKKLQEKVILEDKPASIFSVIQRENV